MDIIKIKTAVYNVLTFPMTLYKKKWLPPYEHVGWPPKEWVCDFEEASDLIFKKLCEEKPCLIGRYGSNEFLCMEYYMKHIHPFWFLRNVWPFWVNKSIKNSMTQNAGFFTKEGNRGYSKFADLYFESAKQVDVLACWFKNQKVS